MHCGIDFDFSIAGHAVRSEKRSKHEKSHHVLTEEDVTFFFERCWKRFEDVGLLRDLQQRWDPPVVLQGSWTPPERLGLWIHTGCQHVHQNRPSSGTYIT